MRMPARRRADAALTLGLERGTAPELGLLPADHPAQPGLQRGDARSQLVSVQREAGLQPERVPGSEAGRLHPGGQQGRPERFGGVDRDGQLQAVLSGVPRPRGQAGHALPHDRDHPEAGHGCGVGGDGRQAGPGMGPLHGDDAPPVGGVLSPDRLEHPFGVRGVGHHVEDPLVHPPDDDVVDHRPVLGEQMRVLSPTGGDLGQIVGERGLKPFEAPCAFDPDRAEMADVEDHRVVAAGAVLGDGALAVGERHLPTPEAHQLGAKPAVAVDEGGLAERARGSEAGDVAGCRRGVAHVERLAAGRVRPCGRCRSGGRPRRPVRTWTGDPRCHVGRAGSAGHPGTTRPSDGPCRSSSSPEVG